MSPIRVTRGAPALRRLLEEQTRDLRALDLAGFRRWLERHLGRWREDPVFARRARIRDLRRAHPQLRALEEELRRATAADAASEHSARLGEVERELNDTEKAIAGLTAALQEATPDRRESLERKLDAFRARRETLQQEQAGLLHSSPARQTLLRVQEELRELRSAIGLDGEEARLQELLSAQGRRSGRAGRTFEERALEVTRTHILPDLLPREADAGERERLCVLTGVTLGAARTEIDQLVIRRPRGAGEPVEVLALVEVKRNLNGLARGFRQRRENLAWLAGDTAGYDPELYRTKRFPSGHFDREALHEQRGESFLLTCASFHRFRRDPAAPIPGPLYFITRSGPLWGISPAGLSRIGHRVATDEDWDTENERYLESLLRWCQALAEPLEAPDVLRLYAATPERARQILLVGQ